MKKKFIILVVFGIIFSGIFGVLAISSLPINGLAEWCESKGGKWSEQAKFCDHVDDFSCVVSGGKYRGCDDHFVSQDGTIQLSPTSMCWQTCQLENKNQGEICESDGTIGIMEFEQCNTKITISTLCTSVGGEWSEQYHECIGFEEKTCKQLDGNYTSCASPCRHNSEETICPAMCVPVCKLP